MRHSRLSLETSSPNHHERLALFQRNRQRLKWGRRIIVTLLGLALGGAGLRGVTAWYASHRMHRADSKSELFKKEGMHQLMLHMHDNRHRPVILQAEQAQERGQGSMQYTLRSPHGWVDMQDHQRLSIKSLFGHVDQKARQITLTHQVQSHYTTGYTMRTEHTLIDLVRNQAQGSCFVEGEGPTSSWRGEGFTYTWGQDQDLLRLKGPATLILEPTP